MANTLTKTGTLFSPAQVSEIFNKVAGHSVLAALSAQTPIPFAGRDSYIFTMDGEASIVGEGANKPAGEAAFKKVNIKPVKVVYQHRLTDEFINMADEARLPYLAQFQDGFAKKIARAVDIIGIHGMNPATKTDVAEVKAKAFTTVVTQTKTFDAANADDNVDAAVQSIRDLDGTPTGIAMAPSFASALGAIKEKTGSKIALYPEFRGVGSPTGFMGLGVSIGNTVSFGTSTIKAIVGDFKSAMKWGYTDKVQLETIEYGDPDGQGDLKRTNEIVLRAEAYIGVGVIDPESFVLIKGAASAGA